MKVVKFGGTSVSSTTIVDVIFTVLEEERANTPKIGEEVLADLVVVCSAFTGITDKLRDVSIGASKGDQSYLTLLDHIESTHHAKLDSLFPPSSPNYQNALRVVNDMLKNLRDLAHGMYLLREASDRSKDLVMSFGERLSTYIISQAVTARMESSGSSTSVLYVDSRDLILTDANHQRAIVNFAVTNANIKRYFQHIKETKKSFVAVVTGYIASTSKGETTTLGRGGSDYSASIFGAALNDVGCQEIQIWTDVDGVYTANPKEVPSARMIQRMSFEEALEMSYFGAKILYAPTMGPAIEKKIPIRIKNTFRPSCEGTLISTVTDKSVVTGITKIDDISLVNLQGCGMVGVAGIANRLFGALAKEKLSVNFISQASSEHSICFAVEPQAARAAKETVEKEFELEILKHYVDGVTVQENLSVIAVIGENMNHTPGVAARTFSALGNRGIDVVAIAQGSSELNISIIVNKRDALDGLRAIHCAFFDPLSVHLFVIGLGTVGGTLIDQILECANESDIQIVAIANSKKMIWKEGSFNRHGWRDALNQGDSTDISLFITKMCNLALPRSVLIDCTAGVDVVPFYEQVLKNGVHVVTPNKKANSGPLQLYKQLRKLSRFPSPAKFLYETNVGAGLPVIVTLQRLVQSGDKLISIEAMLSGTLTYLFTSLSATRAFSQVVREAKTLGYTEPDPRDDLNGMDVARKTLILAREGGLDLEISDIQVQNLVPESCRSPSLSPDEFLEELKKYDPELELQRAEAAKKGGALRYIATLDFLSSKASVSLQQVDQRHPCYNVTGTDNIIVFTTQRYKSNPLVVKGPGAGPAVTAAGVFADIMSLLG